VTDKKIIPQKTGKSLHDKLKHLPEYKQMLADSQRPLRKRFHKRVKKSLQTVTITFQGELIKAHCRSITDRDARPGGDRSAIRTFSPAARKNMLETVSRIDWTQTRATFITLTYHQPVDNAATCKSHLRTFLKRLYRKYGEKVVLWRMDTQQRGCWHFHLIVFELPYAPRTKPDGSGLLDWWRDITGQSTITQFDIQLIRTARKARSYVAKYVGKVGDLAVYLDYLANLPEALLPGRFWGIENRKNITWAELTTWVMRVASEFAGYFDFKRAARQHWDGVNGSRYEGFTIFVRDIVAWERMLHLLIRAEYSAKKRVVSY